jgi:hypothetical protein
MAVVMEAQTTFVTTDMISACKKRILALVSMPPLYQTKLSADLSYDFYLFSQ